MRFRDSENVGAALDLQGLIALYHSDRVGRAVLSYFTSLGKDRYTVSVESVQSMFVSQGKDVTRQQIIEVFKSLREVGFGDFVIGRRTSKTRFRSTISLKAIGQMSAADPQSKEETFTKAILKPNEDTEFTTAQELHGKPHVIAEHNFWLTKELNISLRLPADLTKGEAERLSAYIKTLPID